MRKLKIFLIKLFYLPLIIYNAVYLHLLWRSPWGVALVHAIWHKYKSCALFTERAKYFGTIEAAKMLSYQDFMLFKYLLLHDKVFKKKWLWNPLSIIAEYGLEDQALKSHINLGWKK